MAPGPFLNQGVFGSPATETQTVPAEELGVWRFEAGKILRYVKASALIPRYEAVGWDITATTTAALFGTQVLSAIGETGMLLGVADQATLPLNGYGWITAYGPATARVVTNELPGQRLGCGGQTGVLLRLQITTYFMPRAIAVQTGLSAGSAVFITVL